MTFQPSTLGGLQRTSQEALLGYRRCSTEILSRSLASGDSGSHLSSQGRGFRTCTGNAHRDWGSSLNGRHARYERGIRSSQLSQMGPVLLNETVWNTAWENRSSGLLFPWTFGRGVKTIQYQMRVY